VEKIYGAENVTCTKSHNNFKQTDTIKLIKNKTIYVTDENMADVIRVNKKNESVGFAHSISADFDDPRHMTAGVAVVFKKNFGKPKKSHRITNHIAIQDSQSEAKVFSLITKPTYYSKPNTSDYDAAFKDLTENFTKYGLTHLICSPIGCVRDNIDLQHFVHNIIEFQKQTKATVTIVSYYQRSYRVLRKGVPHKIFNNLLEHLIHVESRIDGSQLKDITSDAVLQPQLETTTPSTAETTAAPVTATKASTTATSAPASQSFSESDEVLVVPGDLTYSEALKQRSDHSVVFSPDCHKNVKAQSPALGLNSLTPGENPIK
jgi:hypothetical protein